MIERLLRLTVNVAWCASMITPIFAAADTASQPSTHVASIELNVGGDFSLTLPPDSSHVAFDLVGGIWVMNTENGAAEALTEITEYNRKPAFAPDGQWIAYESIRDGFHQIMLINKDGETPTQATFGNYHHLAPTWSPDGLSLVFASNRADNFDIWLLDLETSDLHQLTFDRRDEFDPAWNRAGTQLAYVRDDETGSSIHALRPGAKPAELLTEKNRIYGPAWRPDDQVLTYVRQKDGRSQLRMLLLSQPAITKGITRGERVHPFSVHWIDRDSFMYAADGLIRRRNFGERFGVVVPFRAKLDAERDDYTIRKQQFDEIENRPVTGITGISPTGDGRLIVSALGDLWELDSDGMLLRQLTNDSFVEAYPTVSPDGQTLAYVSDRNGSFQVWIMDVETTQSRRLTSESGMALLPIWMPESDGLAYLVASHPTATQLALKRIGLAENDVEVLADTLSVSELPLSQRDGWPVPFNAPPGEDSELSEVPLSWRPFKPEGRLIVRAGRLFDGIGPDYLLEHEIVIQDNRILEVRPWTDDDGTARIIDAEDHTVIPGLIDLSVQQAHASGERVGRAWLAFGVTTIRESVSNLPEATERQESWRSGRRIGPRLFLTVDPCARLSEPADLALLDTVIEDGAHRNISSLRLCPALGSEDLRRMIGAAHSHSLSAVSTTPFPALLLGADEVQLAATEAISNPVATRNMGDARGTNFDDVVAIAGKLNAILISNLASAGMAHLGTRSGLAVHPAFKTLFSQSEQSGYRDAWAQQATSQTDAATASFDSAGQRLFQAIAQGARVATGSGAPNTPYGLGLQAELQLLGRTGLRPFQVLKMATLDAARILGAGDDLGSIHAGKLADLVIVDGDPLRNLADAANVTATIVNGRPYTAGELLVPGGRAGSVGKFYTSGGGD
jgi:Tol biopolymer transport system component